MAKKKSKVLAKKKAGAALAPASALVEDSSGPEFEASVKLSSDIDAIDGDIADMSPDEIEAAATRIIKGNSPEARAIRASRKEVRYKLYRLRSEKEGKSSASDVCDQEFRDYFESQPLFKGWKWFAELWDVSLTEPMRVVARHHGEQQEWEQVMQAKFPQLTTDGRLIYPDIEVQEKVQDEAERRIEAGEPGVIVGTSD